MGFFSWLKGLGNEKRQYSESEIRDKITELLLEMVWIDGNADEKELNHIAHVLAVRYQVEDEEIQRKVDAFDNVTENDIKRLAKDLRDHLPARDRIMLLRDLWSIAIANGFADHYEETLFHLVADLLGITDHQFLEKCVKI